MQLGLIEWVNDLEIHYQMGVPQLDNEVERFYRTLAVDCEFLEQFTFEF
jgi:hypothetical protein